VFVSLQAEIDECQDYPKAVGALEQAVKVLSKLKVSNPTGVEPKISFVTERINTIRRFVDAQAYVSTVSRSDSRSIYVLIQAICQ